MAIDAPPVIITNWDPHGPAPDSEQLYKEYIKLVQGWHFAHGYLGSDKKLIPYDCFLVTLEGNEFKLVPETRSEGFIYTVSDLPLAWLFLLAHRKGVKVKGMQDEDFYERLDKDGGRAKKQWIENIDMTKNVAQAFTILKGQLETKLDNQSGELPQWWLNKQQDKGEFLGNKQVDWSHILKLEFPYDNVDSPWSLGSPASKSSKSATAEQAGTKSSQSPPESSPLEGNSSA